MFHVSWVATFGHNFHRNINLRRKLCMFVMLTLAYAAGIFIQGGNFYLTYIQKKLEKYARHTTKVS